MTAPPSINKIKTLFNITERKKRKSTRAEVYNRIAIANVLKKAYKRMTLHEIAQVLDVDHSTVAFYFRRHDELNIYRDYLEIYKEKEQIMTANREEDRIQIECYTWFHNTYPELRGLLCYNYNNPRSAMEGAKAKRMGLQPHRPDFTFYYRSRAYFAELKTPTSKPRRGQLDYHALLSTHNFDTTIIRTLAEFQEWVRLILT